MSRILIGEWQLTRSSSRIDMADEYRQLTPQQLALLNAFIFAPDNTLSKDDLIRHVWKGRIVSDDLSLAPYLSYVSS